MVLKFRFFSVCRYDINLFFFLFFLIGRKDVALLHHKKKKILKAYPVIICNSDFFYNGV